MLVKLSTYELVVRLNGGTEAVVMKHAVDWIEPAGETTSVRGG